MPSNETLRKDDPRLRDPKYTPFIRFEGEVPILVRDANFIRLHEPSPAIFRPEQTMACDVPVTNFAFNQDLEKEGAAHTCVPGAYIVKKRVPKQTLCDGGRHDGGYVNWYGDCEMPDPNPDMIEQAVFRTFNLIGHDPETGKTCMLRGKRGRVTRRLGNGQELVFENANDGRNRPTLDDSRFAEMYKLPTADDGRGCVTCHNNHALLVTPRIAQLFEDRSHQPIPVDVRDGMPSSAQPQGARLETRKRAIKHSHRNDPYILIDGGQVEKALRDGNQQQGGTHPFELDEFTFRPFRLNPGVAPKCQKCHDMGGGRQCKEFVEAAFEPDVEAEDSTPGSARSELTRSSISLTKRRLYRDVAWHIPILPEAIQRHQRGLSYEYKQFREDYGASYDAVLSCCMQPWSDECWNPLSSETFK